MIAMSNIQCQQVNPFHWIRQIDLRDLDDWYNLDTGDTTSDVTDIIAQTTQLETLLLPEVTPSSIFTLASRISSHSLHTLHLSPDVDSEPGIKHIGQLGRLARLKITFRSIEVEEWPTTSADHWNFAYLLELTWTRPPSNAERASLDLEFLIACQFPDLKKLTIGTRPADGFLSEGRRQLEFLVMKQAHLRVLDISGSLRKAKSYKHYMKHRTISTLAFYSNLPEASLVHMLPVGIRVLDIAVDPSSRYLRTLWPLFDELCKSSEKENKEVRISFTGGRTFSWTTPANDNDPAEGMFVRRLVGYATALSKLGVRVLDQFEHGINLT
jgi:hypothetical protein